MALPVLVCSQTSTWHNNKIMNHHSMKAWTEHGYTSPSSIMQSRKMQKKWNIKAMLIFIGEVRTQQNNVFFQGCG